uniref:modulator of macroautophagy TMEM150B-like n=1 Tax=Styela clava TaxID=7725 RepID=UPI00193A5402|nr:modulator of macroautophagy TMEM150B-like [Styela clava]
MKSLVYSVMCTYKMWNFKSCMLLPLRFLVLTVCGLLSCYGIASLEKNFLRRQNETPAYVSHFGMYLPESSLFVFVFNWSAACLFVMCLSFYKFVCAQLGNSLLNVAAFVFGCITSSGITVVACFPWRDHLVGIHITGAAMAFCGGTLQCWLICLITWKLCRKRSGFPYLFLIRITLASIHTVCIILLGSFLGLIFLSNWEKREPAVISEWIMLFAQLLFYTSMSHEFSKIKFIQLELKYFKKSSRTLHGVCNEVVEMEISEYPEGEQVIESENTVKVTSSSNDV